MNATEKAVVVERSVRLVKMPEFDATVEREGVRLAEVCEAIGYLSQWALHKDEKRIVKVNVGLMDDGGMHALYRDSDDRIVYEIGAVLRDGGKYSFHS
jgi:hypothetical protein